MANVSSPGLGSGLDVTGIVSQLVALERKPIENLESAASTIQTQISAFGKVASLMSTLRDAAANLNKSTLWAGTTASSADAASVSVTSTGGAASGSYQVSVSQLATAHSLASGMPAFTSASAVVGAGQMKIDLGTWSAGSFSAKTGSTQLVLDFTDPGTTLAQVRDKINAANAGVTASIVSDASGARLTLTSKGTGAENALRVQTSGAGFAGLGYDPQNGVNALTQTQAAANAKATINGLAVESASNTLTNVVDGVNLSLSKVTTSPVAISVASDTNGIKTAITAFVTAYNALNSYVGEQTKYDEATETAGSLQGDSTAVGLRNQMRNLLREANGASSTFKTLSDIGLAVQRDGSISVTNSKLEAALGNLPELTKLFSSTDAAVPGNNGLAGRWRKFADTLTGSEGLLTTRTDGLKASLKRNSKEQDRLEERVERVQARLLKQYQALDAQMANLNGLSSYVSAQMTALSKTSTR